MMRSSAELRARFEECWSFTAQMMMIILSLPFYCLLASLEDLHSLAPRDLLEHDSPNSPPDSPIPLTAAPVLTPCPSPRLLPFLRAEHSARYPYIQHVVDDLRRELWMSLYCQHVGYWLIRCRGGVEEDHGVISVSVGFEEDGEVRWRSGDVVSMLLVS